MDPGFIFSVYEDWQLCRRLILQIRSHYPANPVICLTDGTHDSQFEKYCQHWDIDYRPTERRLKQAQNGGLWLERLYGAALELGTEQVIKTEGDCCLWRRLTIPDCYLAGTLNHRNGRPFVRGGLYVIKNFLIRQILESGLLQLESYKIGRQFRYDRYGRYGHEHEQHQHPAEPISLSDLILGDICHRLGVSPVEWAEIQILFRGTPSAGYGATHPHP